MSFMDLQLLSKLPQLRATKRGSASQMQLRCEPVKNHEAPYQN